MKGRDYYSLDSLSNDDASRFRLNEVAMFLHCNL